MTEPRGADPSGSEPDESLAVVTAIVLNWNHATVTIGLLHSLETSFAQGIRAVVVDNGSVDNSVATLRSFLEQFRYGLQVELIESSENLGFTGGVNLGVERALAANASPEFILLINPDGVAGPATVPVLLAAIRASGAGIMSYEVNQWALDAWPRVFYARPDNLLSRQILGAWRLNGSYAGACVLFRSSLLRLLIAEDGHFQDPSLFFYWDEWDVSLRSRRLGALIAAAQGTSYRHEGDTRGLFNPHSPFRDYYSARNSVLVARRELSSRNFWTVFVVHLLRDVSWRLRLMTRGVRTPWRVYARGTWDGLRGESGRWDRHPLSPPPTIDEVPSGTDG